MSSLKLKKPRFSPQREHLLSLFSKTHEHLSVQEIFARAKKKHPKISRATVYRDLQQLEELQKISSTQGPGNVTYYESRKEPHHHFVCRGCKSISNLEAPTVNMCVSCITKKAPVKIETVVTTIFGLCEKCKDR